MMDDVNRDFSHKDACHGSCNFYENFDITDKYYLQRHGNNET